MRFLTVGFFNVDFVGAGLESGLELLKEAKLGAAVRAIGDRICLSRLEKISGSIKLSQLIDFLK